MASAERNQQNQGGLGLFDAISIIVGIVIGTMIFKLPWLIFRSTSDPWMGLAVWLLGGILALIGALCYAELATTYPRSGGDYYYLTRAFGPGMGFLFGWAQLLVVFTASIGIMAFVFGEYAMKIPFFERLAGHVDLKQLDSELGDVGLNPEFAYACVAVIVLTFLNLLGVMMGKITQNFLTLVKIVSLAAILVAGFGWAQSSPQDWHLANQEPGAAGKSIGWAALAMILVLYAYGGWNDAAFVAAEVRNPQRNIPRALIIGVSLITLVYLAINMAYLMGLGFEGAKTPDVPGRLLERAVVEWKGEDWKGWGREGMSLLIVISALGAASGLIFTGARVYATLGNDYTLFGWLGHWQPGKRAPILALLVQALFTLGMIFMLGTTRGHEIINDWLTSIHIEHDYRWTGEDAFDALFAHTAPVFWIFFMMTGFSLFLLRARDTGLARPFSVPFYPWLPIIFCSTCAFMLFQSTVHVGWRALFAMGLVLLGIPFYWLACLFGGYKGDVVRQ